MQVAAPSGSILSVAPPPGRSPQQPSRTSSGGATASLPRTGCRRRRLSEHGRRRWPFVAERQPRRDVASSCRRIVRADRSRCARGGGAARRSSTRSTCSTTSTTAFFGTASRRPARRTRHPDRVPVRAARKVRQRHRLPVLASHRARLRCVRRSARGIRWICGRTPRTSRRIRRLTADLHGELPHRSI